MRKGRFAGLPIAAPGTAGSNVGRTAAQAAILAAPVLAALPAIVGAGATGTLSAIVAAVVIIAMALSMLRKRAGPDLDQGDARPAPLLVADFEASESGWFWETNADGLLTYVSAPFAVALGRAADTLLGRPFGELALVEERQADEQRPALDFHFSSRFPFSNLIVRAIGGPEQRWSLTGSPRFDAIGRFLGFHGFALRISESRRQEIRSIADAGRDSLTGLPNRGNMRLMLDEAMANADGRKEGCALLLIDLDRFKQVNDTLGHPIGDLLLKEVAFRLSAAIGSAGQVGRLGGDEFEALLPGIDEEGTLAALAEAVIGRVSAPYQVRGHAISIGASVGIAISRPGRTLVDALIKEADLALYAAKKAGRGTYRFFESHMHSEETERQILETDLKLALAKGELRLVFQPVVSAATEDLVGFEALLRWKHPVRGLLAPADFLSIAEASGIIAGIGEWVVRTACAQAAAWPKHLRLSVNLSLAELQHPQLVATVASAMAASAIDPERLEFDLPEQALLSDDHDIDTVLTGLKSLGVSLALDDFGRGAASVISFRSVPLNRIKLHPDLIRLALPKDGRARSVVTSVVELAQRLAMEVTAEGVESLEERVVARMLGCSDIQGFLFGRPMAAEEAGELAALSKPVSVGKGFRPRPPRHSLIRRVALRLGNRSLAVRIRNISAEGAMIESEEELTEGAEIALELSDGLRIAGEVRWSQDGRVGVRFAEAFDLKRLGRTGRGVAAPSVLKPDYLASELAPDSPWAARQERLSVRDVKRR